MEGLAVGAVGIEAAFGSEEFVVVFDECGGGLGLKGEVFGEVFIVADEAELGILEDDLITKAEGVCGRARAQLKIDSKFSARAFE